MDNYSIIIIYYNFKFSLTGSRMINTLTISQAHNKLKNKEISCEELTKSCIERIEKTDPLVNAVIYKNFNSALSKAKKIDSENNFYNPLTGIPYLSKDVFCEEDVPTTACSNILRNPDYVTPFSSTTTKRLEACGAISIGKTNTDEFTMGSSTETSCYGVTKCPWDLTRVAGGSSGGSAAAVSSDESIFALGTDTGGSIRQPAGFCGCTGIRVTYGRTSRFGVMSMASSLDTIGPLAKSVEDLCIILSAISGKDELDATTSDLEVPDYQSILNGSVKGMTIGISKDYFPAELDNEVREHIENAIKVFKKLGAITKEISLPHTKYALPAYYIIVPSEISSNMARYDGIRFGHTEKAKDLIEYYFSVRSAGFGDEVKRRIMIGTFALSAGYYDAYYRQAQRVRTLIKQDFEKAFEKVDLIVSPMSPTPAFKIGSHTDDPVAMYLEDIFSIPQALAGIPALSIPCGFSKENLPIALQIMGPQWGEPQILKAANAFEKEVWPGGLPKPNI